MSSLVSTERLWAVFMSSTAILGFAVLIALALIAVGTTAAMTNGFVAPFRTAPPKKTPVPPPDPGALPCSTLVTVTKAGYTGKLAGVATLAAELQAELVQLGDTKAVVTPVTPAQLGELTAQLQDAADLPAVYIYADGLTASMTTFQGLPVRVVAAQAPPLVALLPVPTDAAALKAAGNTAYDAFLSQGGEPPGFQAASTSAGTPQYGLMVSTALTPAAVIAGVKGKGFTVAYGKAELSSVSFPM